METVDLVLKLKDKLVSTNSAKAHILCMSSTDVTVYTVITTVTTTTTAITTSTTFIVVLQLLLVLIQPLLLHKQGQILPVMVLVPVLALAVFALLLLLI